jgi:hypothetical protein
MEKARITPFPFTDYVPEWLRLWKEYFEECWQRPVSLENLFIPKKPDWARSLLIMHPIAATPTTAFNQYIKNWVVGREALDSEDESPSVWPRPVTASSLDAIFFRNDRRRPGLYALWHRGLPEADERFIGISASQVLQLSSSDDTNRKIKTMRLVEYLEFASFFRWHAGKSIDLLGSTLMPETRTPFGKIAKGNWGTYGLRGLRITIDYPGTAGPYKSVREIAT